MIRLGSLPTSFYFSIANGVSGDGSVAVGASDISQGSLAAFRWTQATGLLPLGFLPGEQTSVARAASADGSVIVGFSGLQAFRWTETEGLVGLGASSAAFGVSGDGSVVVGFSTSARGTEAFRWTQQTGLVGLGDLGGAAFQSQATAVSSNGAVIVGASDSATGQQAFRWTQAGGMVGLGDLMGSSASIAQAVSADGSVIVGDSFANFDASQHIAFIWDSSDGIRNLRDILISQGDDLTGWILSQAKGISADGKTIVGAGFNPDGQPEAWLARLGAQTNPIPEPSSLILLGSAVLLLLRPRRSKYEVGTAGDRGQRWDSRIGMDH
jgi:probable HAF family extracellular repeat protein